MPRRASSAAASARRGAASARARPPKRGRGFRHPSASSRAARLGSRLPSGHRDGQAAHRIGPQAPAEEAATAAPGPGARRRSDQCRVRQLAPRRRSGRRGAGAVVSDRAVSALPRLRRRPGRGDDPQGGERERGRRPARRFGRRLQQHDVPDSRHPGRQALRAAPRHLHPARGRELRRRDRRPHHARAGAEHRHGHDPRGAQPGSDRAARQAGRAQRQLCEGQRSLQVPQPGSLRGPGPCPQPGGIPVPRHLPGEGQGPAQPISSSSSFRTSSAVSRAWT